MPETTTVSKWLAGIATLLLVAGIIGDISINFYNQRTLAQLETEWNRHSEEDHETRQRLHDLENELRRPGGAYRRFTSDDGARLKREFVAISVEHAQQIVDNEKRIRKVEQDIVERNARCIAEDKRVSKLEAQVDQMQSLLFSGRNSTRR